jgi:capsular polysaccharide export protein
MGRRSFLLLQGPVGPFFERVGQELRRRGHQVTRINLNGGDLVQWRLAGARSFRCAARDWPGYLDDLARRAGVSDLVMFGDCRPRHRIAARVMAQLGVRRHVFEEGYFRPDWITLERSGVNGYSGLPRDPAFYREEGALLLGRPWRPSQPVGPALRAMIGGALACYAGVAVLRPWFAGHRSQRPYSAQFETLGWLERAVGLRARRRAAAARRQALLADPAPFFVLARQLDAAMQVRRHSPFAGMSQVIRTTVDAFARSAPEAACLVVKNHPFACGLIDLARVLRHAARAADVGSRVVDPDGGDLPSLLERAAGLVVVNSTAGLSAIPSRRADADAGQGALRPAPPDPRRRPRPRRQARRLLARPDAAREHAVSRLPPRP